MTKRMVWIVSCLVLTFAAGSALALPNYAQDIWYYDANGDPIGYYTLMCSGAHSSSGTTSSTYSVITTPCGLNPWMTCADQGLSTLSGCGNDWCYSSSYVQEWGWDLVDNCAGLCYFSEGPGASGNKYCTTCWKGTGSCPARSRPQPRPHQRPTLRAAVGSMLWKGMLPSFKTIAAALH